MSDITNELAKCNNNQKENIMVVLPHMTTNETQESYDTEEEDEEDDDEIEEVGPGLEESRSLLNQTYIPCSSGTNLHLSLSLRSYEGFLEKYTTSHPHPHPHHHHNSLSTTMAVVNISSNNAQHDSSISSNFGLHKHHVFQDSMVTIGLSEDFEEEAECNSSSSPFHSAAEDFSVEHEPGRTRDRDPLLIKGPAKKGGFHHFLTGTKSSIIRSNNNDETISRRKEQKPRSFKNKIDEQQIIRRPMCSYGILLATISCIFFATSALIVKVSSIHPMELLAVRGLIQWILVSPIVISSGNSFFGPKESRSLLLARAVLGSVALIMSFASIHLIPLADAATVIFTSPVFVSIFACVCLGELCSCFDVAMIILTLLGVLLVSKPSFAFINSGSWVGIAGTSSGLAASMLTALAFIVLRQLKHVHYSVTVLWFSTVLASFGIVLTIALDGFTIPTQWLSIIECIAIGVCGFFGQILLTKALQIENAGPVAVARTIDIVLAFFYQITLLHDSPDWYSYLGSLLVVSCVLLTALRRWYIETHMTKRNDKTIGANQIIS